MMDVGWMAPSARPRHVVAVRTYARPVIRYRGVATPNQTAKTVPNETLQQEVTARPPKVTTLDFIVRRFEDLPPSD
jgi:hypothetical protein